MTVGTSSPRETLVYTGPTDYDFTFSVLDEADLDVSHKETDGTITQLVISTDYTVALNPDGTGTASITYDSPAGGPYTGSIIFARNMAIDQSVDWVNGGPLDMERLEKSFDKITMIAQQISQSIEVGASAYNWRGSWVIGNFYNVNELVKESSNVYICAEAHTAGTFATDLSAGKWELIFDIAAAAASAAAAATSASNAATSETNAATSESNAATSASNASTSETNAAASASAASTSESNAATSETNAAASASAASTSESNAATSATNAATSETNAAASAAEAKDVLKKWTFDTSTTMADPGAGDLRLNNATFASVTAVAIDDTSANTGNPDFAAWLIAMDDSDSTIKGYLYISKVEAPENFLILQVDSLTDNAGWVQVGVTHVASNGSFSATDVLKVQFTRTGDKGDTGATGATGANGDISIAGINEQTGTTYSTVASDRGKMIDCNNASAFTLTVEKNLFAQNEIFYVRQKGAGQVTVAAGTGVTINYPSTSFSNKTLEQYAMLTLVCVDDTPDANVFALGGMLASA